MALQALIVKYDESFVLDLVEVESGDLSQLLPAEVVSDFDATKENVIERVASRSASLVHFLVHGTPGGRAGHHRRKKSGEGKKKQELGFFVIFWNSITSI